MTQTSTFNTPRGPLQYRDSGHGPVVIALHGAMGGHDQSSILAEAALGGDCSGECGDFRVLAISRPGYLGTPLALGTTPVEQADLLAALLDHLGIQQAVLLAISGGGPAALEFALRHRTRCQALVLISTVAGPNPVRLPPAFRWLCQMARWQRLTAWWQRRALARIPDHARRAVPKAADCQRLLDDADSRRLYTALVASTFEQMAARLPGTFNDIDVTRSTDYALEDIRVPTLVIHGSADRIVPYRHAQQFHQRLPQVEQLDIPDGEHVALFTHRALIRQTIAAFLRQHLGVPPTDA